MGKLIDKINKLLFEEVEIETQYDEKTNKVKSKTTKVLQQQDKKETTVKNKPVEKSINPEPVKEQNVVEKEEPTFLNVTNKARENVKPVEKKEKNVYIPKNVISPIFGESKGLYSTNSSSLDIDYENEVNRRSIIGTVFSPINGDGSNVQSVANDPIDENIAAMTIDDFIVPNKTETVKKNDVPTLMTKKERAVFQYQPLEKAIKEEKNTSNKKDAGLTIENLSLFD
ncbi:MAG: hypothetical protein Q4C64_00585 [Erysipelotrichia bacterium]|nr:hypothetical protein [Erysipelotrichia bacterium]